jgi:hypothetical protein
MKLPSLIQVEPAPAPAPIPVRQPVQITMSADALLLLGALGWLLWRKLVRPSVVQQLDGVFAPIEEERQLTAMLAQIGAVTGASRVVLAAFHNGQIDNFGFHLQKLTTVNQYVAPGCEPMPFPIRDLPIGRVIVELELLMANPGWVTVELEESLPQACQDHLRRNEMRRMTNRLIRVGNLPIGILSLQYVMGERRLPDLAGSPYDAILERLVEDIGSIMRRRVIHPGRLRLLLGKLLGIGRGVRHGGTGPG